MTVVLSSTAIPALQVNPAAAAGACDPITSAQVGSDGSGNPICQAIFQSSGTFTVPSVGTTSIDVYLVGSGGGGGGGDGDANQPLISSVSGGGGAGGSQAIYQNIPVTGGDTFTVTVGAAGAGGASGSWSGATHTPAQNGADGGTTSLGTYTAVGGGGGKAGVYNVSGSTSGDGGSVGTNASAAASTTARTGGPAAAHATGDTRNFYFAGGGGAGSSEVGTAGIITCTGTPCGSGSVVQGGLGGRGTFITKSGSLFPDTSTLVSSVNLALGNQPLYWNIQAFQFGPGGGGGVTTGDNSGYFQGHAQIADPSLLTDYSGNPYVSGPAYFAQSDLRLWGGGAMLSAPNDWTVVPAGGPSYALSFADLFAVDGFGGGGGGGSGILTALGAAFGMGARGTQGIVIVRWVSTQAPPSPVSTTTTYTGPTSVNVGGTYNPSANVVPTDTSTCTGAVSYEIYFDPTIGNPFGPPLIVTGSVNTSTWYPGVYNVTAIFAGDAHCLASQSSGSDILTVAPPATTGGASWGGGWYSLGTGTGTKPNFGFEVQTFPKKGTTPGYTKGQLAWVQKGNWKFKGTLNSVACDGSGNCTASGSGNLFYWKKSGSGGNWVAATVGSAGVTIAYSPTTPSTKKTSGSPGAFTIGFQGDTSGTGSPALPQAASSPTTLSQGNVKVNA